MPPVAASPPVPPAGDRRVVRVVPDVRALRKDFDYLVPPEVAARVRVGTQVRVVLHGRRVGGWVVADHVAPPDGVALRPLAAVRGWGPPPAVLELCAWAAWRWAGPRTGFLRTASSPVAVRALPAPRSGGRGRGPGGPGAGPEGGPAAGAAVPAEVVGAALAGGTAVVRLAPAADPLPLVAGAAARLGRGGAGSGVLVLAPAHAQAAAVAARLRGAGLPVALLPGDWAAARAGGCVAVGTRAGAFAPLPRLDAAVVLDAHDEAYHEERAPTWAAWAVVEERCRRDGAPCVLVSPCPTLELLGGRHPLTTSRAAERRGWPALEVVDRRHDDPRTGLFSERLVALVRSAAPGRRVVCVVNRTGRVRLLACAACGDLARCETCGGALELGGGDGPPVLHCRRCGAERPVVCARCGATRTRALRLGVSRVAEELAALAGTPVAQVWGPAAPATGEDPDRAPVVVGTEAALHRVGAAHAVAFLDFDAELLAPRFRAGEQALALLARAARLVAGGPPRDATPGTGGGAAGWRAPGRVLVQTRQPQHPALEAAVSADPGVLAGAEAEVRRALGLPPFGAVATVSGAGAPAYGPDLAAAAPPGVEVRGPSDGVWWVRAPDHASLCDLLAGVARPEERLRVEVDPVRA